MDPASVGERVSQRKRRSSLSTENNHINDKEEEKSPLHHFHGLCEDSHRVLDNTAAEYYNVIIPSVLNQAQFYVRQTTSRLDHIAAAAACGGSRPFTCRSNPRRP